jgi:hypothetical protein
MMSSLSFVTEIKIIIIRRIRKVSKWLTWPSGMFVLEE